MSATWTQWEGDIPSGKEAMWILAGQVDAAVRKLSCAAFFCSHAFLSFVCMKELMSMVFILSPAVTFAHCFSEHIMFRNSYFWILCQKNHYVINTAGSLKQWSYG